MGRLTLPLPTPSPGSSPTPMPTTLFPMLFPMLMWCPMLDAPTMMELSSPAPMEVGWLPLLWLPPPSLLLRRPLLSLWRRERPSLLPRPLPRLRLTPRLTPGCTTLDSMEVTTAMLPTTTPPSPTPMLPTPTDTPMLTTEKGLLMPTSLGHPMHPKRERPSLSLRPPPMLRLTPRLIPGSTTPESGEDTTAMLPTA